MKKLSKTEIKNLIESFKNLINTGEYALANDIIFHVMMTMDPLKQRISEAHGVDDDQLRDIAKTGRDLLNRLTERWESLRAEGAL